MKNSEISAHVPNRAENVAYHADVGNLNVRPKLIVCDGAALDR